MLRKIWNVPSIEFNYLSEHSEKGKVALIHGGAAWQVVRGALKLTTASESEATETTEAHWRSLAEKAQGEVVYGVGGGLAADAAKYVAAARKLPLVLVPTAISCDAFFTSSSAARADGGVEYLETKPAERVVIDPKIIAGAPAHLRAAGICDLLSIATARWDWKYADDSGTNPEGMAFIEFADQTARGIFRGALECASPAGRGDASGIKQLVDCLALEVQLCNQLGHSRPAAGSEHYFAYALESHLGEALPHGNLVGPGIIAIAGLQAQETATLRAALEGCHIPLNDIPAETIRAVLRDLPAYCRRQNLPHGIAHDLTEPRIAKVA